MLVLVVVHALDHLGPHQRRLGDDALERHHAVELGGPQRARVAREVAEAADVGAVVDDIVAALVARAVGERLDHVLERAVKGVGKVKGLGEQAVGELAAVGADVVDADGEAALAAVEHDEDVGAVAAGGHILCGGLVSVVVFLFGVAVACALSLLPHVRGSRNSSTRRMRLRTSSSRTTSVMVRCGAVRAEGACQDSINNRALNQVHKTESSAAEMSTRGPLVVVLGFFFLVARLSSLVKRGGVEAKSRRRASRAAWRVSWATTAALSSLGAFLFGQSPPRVLSRQPPIFVSAQLRLCLTSLVSGQRCCTPS